ncbi:serine/arginine repetitive matrix protein 2-like [Lineus longissimus]|uniref:serine/arginine repetitive matrix protein 2-like n=1 Tax=Lineus longissimus TaxID=88925 RepID=UPI002B4F30A8
MKMADTSSVCSDLDSGIGSCSPTSTGPGTAYIPEHKSVQTFRNTEDYLYAMKEDLAEWLNCLYNLEITVDTFFKSLDTGVLLCEHAAHVQDMAEEYRDESGEESLDRMYDDFGQGGLLSRNSDLRKKMKIPDKGPVYKKIAKPGTFLARDNIANFIAWCRALGIPDVLLFETEDLVSRKNEKSVVLCLLEVARQGSKFGMLVPCLIQLEQEIDAEIRGEPPPPPPPMKPKEPEVYVQKKTCDMRSLDEMVRDLVSQCTCHIQFPVVRLGEGKYMVGEKETLIFVRILRNHVMVRVGGGWDTFGNYLNKHDPCRECKNQRIVGKSNTTTATPPQFSNKRRGSAPPQSLSVFKPKESPRNPEVSSTRLRKLSQSSEDILSDDSESSTPRSRSGTLKRENSIDGFKSPRRTSSFRKPTSSKSSDQICNGRVTPTPSLGIPHRSSRESSVPTGPAARRRLSMDTVAKSTPSSVSADSSPAMTRKQRSGSTTELSENYSNLQSKTDQLQSRLRELDRKDTRERRANTPTTSKSLEFSRYQPRSTTPGPETPRQRKISGGDMSTRMQRRPTTPSREMFHRERSVTPGPEAVPESRIAKRSTTPGPESRRSTTPGPEGRRCTTPGPESRRCTTPGPESRRCTTPGPESRHTKIERRPTTPQPQRRKISEPSTNNRAALSQPGTPVTQRRAQPMTSQDKNKLSRSGSFRTGKELRSNSITNGISRGSSRRGETPESQSSDIRHRTGSLNNIDCGKLSVNYDEIEDIGGNEQLYLEMEKLFVEYKESEQAKSAIEDELDRRIRDKIKPDVEKYKEKQAQREKDCERKRDRTNSLNQSLPVGSLRSEHRRASTNSVTNNTEVPKNGLRSSSVVNSQCQISNSKLSKTASKPLEPRQKAPTGNNPSTAVVPPFSYSETSKKENESSEDNLKQQPTEEEHDPETRMIKTRNDIEKELEQRIRAKIQESRRTPEREGRSKTPGKPSERGRTPDRGRPPDKGKTPERGRTPVRGVTPERGRTTDRVNASTPQRGQTPDRVKASERGRTHEKSVASERGRTPDRSSASQRGRTQDRGPGTEQSRPPSRGVTPDRTTRSKTPDPAPARCRTPDPVITRSKTPDPIARQRRCQTPDPFTRSRKTDTERSRPQVRSRTPDPSSARKWLNSTGSVDSSDRQSSGTDSNVNLYASIDSLANFSDSLDPFRYGSMENIAKPRKDDRDGMPTKIPGPMTMHKSATCSDFSRSGSQISLDSFEDDEVGSITKNAEYFRKHRPSAPDVLKLRMQSPLITARSTIVNKKLPSPTKEKKSDGIKAMTAIHFV